MEADAGGDNRGHMDISHQKQTWARFGQMVKWGIILTAILGILATYLTYLSHY